MINQAGLDKLSIQSRTFDWLRFPFILLVITQHVGKTVIPDLTDFNILQINFAQFSGDDFYHIFRAVMDALKSISNPGFFLISGYLFFYNVTKWSKEVYINKLKRRVSTLLIPYLSWNVITALGIPIYIVGSQIFTGDGDWGRLTDYWNSIVEKGFLNLFWHFNTWGEDNVNILGWNTPSLGPVSVPMWFLETLICLSIITPLIYMFIKYLRIFGIVALGILCFTGIWFSLPGLGISSIFYFSLGAYFSINKKNMVFELRRARFVLFPTAIITHIGTIIFRYGIETPFNYTGGIFVCSATLCAIVMSSYLIEKEKIEPNKLLSQSIFFIYASHSPLFIVRMVATVFGLATLRSQNWAILTLGYIITPVMTALLCYVGYLIIKKIMPPVCKLLAGNR